MNTSHAGRWHRSGGALVINLDSPYGGFDDGYEDELTTTQLLALKRELEAARKALRDVLKDMKALKTWVGMGPDDGPFLDAFTAARNNAKALAPRFTAAANAFVIPATATVVDARKLLQDFLEDMEALKDWATAGTDPQLFMAAFNAARTKAKLVSPIYIAALRAP